MTIITELEFPEGWDRPLSDDKTKDGNISSAQVWSYGDKRANRDHDYLLGPHFGEPTDHQVERWQALVDAEDAFERIIGQAARTAYPEGNELLLRVSLSSVLGAWQCVLKARES